MSDRRFRDARIAYFTMEIGLESDLPTYAGGLGVLAGDTAKSAADLGLAFVAVSLLHRRGYFRQTIGPDGVQQAEPVSWHPEERLVRLGPTAQLVMDGRPVRVHAWQHLIVGHDGAEVPVVFLDTDVDGNHDEDRALTRDLYGGDHRHRLRQELLLGVGGIRMLRALDAHHVRHYHLNEGHAALILLELVREEAGARGMPYDDDGVLRSVRRRSVFTTHTPVSAGHDRFGIDLVRSTLPPDDMAILDELRRAGAVEGGDELNLTTLGMSLCGWCNAVAQRHAEVSRVMFPGRRIAWITNGVHSGTWVAPPLAALYDRQLHGWRHDPATLRNAWRLDDAELRAAHAEAKRLLLETVRARTGIDLDPQAFTIGFGRRATPYKRMDLVLSDPARLEAIARAHGPLQIVFGGKAHPKDDGGKGMIREVNEHIRTLPRDVRAIYLPGYDMASAGAMVAGVDLWLNTPMPPMEASGTSGMKAALNGVPSLSTMDGWWVEGCVEGVTGWAIGADEHRTTFDEAVLGDVAARRADADHLYEALEQRILPVAADPARWAAVMRGAIAVNGAWFTTQRMVMEYATRAWT